jgi:hypothetical protein
VLVQGVQAKGRDVAVFHKGQRVELAIPVMVVISAAIYVVRRYFRDLRLRDLEWPVV